MWQRASLTVHKMIIPEGRGGAARFRSAIPGQYIFMSPVGSTGFTQVDGA